MKVLQVQSRVVVEAKMTFPEWTEKIDMQRISLYQNCCAAICVQLYQALLRVSGRDCISTLLVYPCSGLGRSYHLSCEEESR